MTRKSLLGYRSESLIPGSVIRKASELLTSQWMTPSQLGPTNVNRSFTLLSGMGFADERAVMAPTPQNAKHSSQVTFKRGTVYRKKLDVVKDQIDLNALELRIYTFSLEWYRSTNPKPNPAVIEAYKHKIAWFGPDYWEYREACRQKNRGMK